MPSSYTWIYIKPFPFVSSFISTIYFKRRREEASAGKRLHITSDFLMLDFYIRKNYKDPSAVSARISRNAWSCHPFYPKTPFAPIKLQRNMVFFPKPNTKYNTWGKSRIVITISVCVSVHLFIHLHRYICTRMWIPQCRANVSHTTLHHIC